MLDESQLNQDAKTLTPLPEVLSRGLIAVTVCSFASFVSSVALFCFLTYRLFQWRWKTGNWATNQFFLLVYNLLLADIQQALAFSLNISSLIHDGIFVGTATCWIQGWFLSNGDLASSVFILAIAIHTFLAVVLDYRLPQWAFYSWLAACWTFVYGLGVIGAAMHPQDLYVRASAWCWINSAYQSERLLLHYLWLFIAMFATITLYGITFVILRIRAPRSAPIPHGATPIMILYPTIYTLCTSPLAAGRIVALAGYSVSLAYFCVAGAMIASNGFLDVLLYSTTRRSIIFGEEAPGETDYGIGTFIFFGQQDTRFGNVTTIEGGIRQKPPSRPQSHISSLFHRKLLGRKVSSASTRTILVDDEIPDGFVGIVTETTFKVESVPMTEMNNLHRRKSTCDSDPEQIKESTSR